METNQNQPLRAAEIISIVQTATTEAIAAYFKNKANREASIVEDYLSAEQAAEFLKIKINTIYSKVEKGDLPHYRSGKRKLLFSKNELEQYVARRKGKTVDDISGEAEEYLLKNSPK